MLFRGQLNAGEPARPAYKEKICSKCPTRGEPSCGIQLFQKMVAADAELVAIHNVNLNKEALHAFVTMANQT